jgi:hypothetical protein
MADWHNFYMLAGGTAGTLIGLIFIVITLGMEHSKAGDEVRTRLFVTPILVHFACLLIIALVMVAPTSTLTRALALGAIGCARLRDQSRAHLATANRHRRSRALVGRAAANRELCAGCDRSGFMGT